MLRLCLAAVFLMFVSATAAEGAVSTNSCSSPKKSAAATVLCAMDYPGSFVITGRSSALNNIVRGTVTCGREKVPIVRRTGKHIFVSVSPISFYDDARQAWQMMRGYEHCKLKVTASLPKGVAGSIKIHVIWKGRFHAVHK